MCKRAVALAPQICSIAAKSLHAAAQAAVPSAARYASQAGEVLYMIFSNWQGIPPDFLAQHQRSSDCLLLDWLPPDEV